MKKIIVGTRGSKLALWQAEHVADLLRGEGLVPETKIIETKGDKVLDVSIAKIGSKGVFTEELEDQLYNGSIHIAVHSAKDLPSSLPDRLQIIAFTEREKANDVIISHKKEIDLNDQDLILGTSSTRRIAMLRHYYGNITTREIRGNLQTRIRKMEEGQCDALLLAYAGVLRMGYTDMIVRELPINQFTPAVGQGSLAIEASQELETDLSNKIRQALNHSATENLLLAERAFLKELEGGCSIPAFALASYVDEKIELNAGILSLDGKQIVRRQKTFTVPDDPKKSGQALAMEILENGGQEILEKIKSHLH